MQTSISGSQQWKSVSALNEMRKLSSPGNVEVKLLRNDSTIQVNIKPERYFENDQNKTQPVRFFGDSLVYIDLSQIGDFDLEKLYRFIFKCDNILVDLRKTPLQASSFLSHLMTMNDTSGQWMQIPVLCSPADRSVRFRNYSWELTPQKPQYKGKLYFLTDAGTIGYGESILGYVKNYKIGTVLGKTSAGANGNVNSTWLPGNYLVSWTGMRVVNHDGSGFWGTGIKPDVELTSVSGYICNGEDELISEAIKYIFKK